MKKVLFTLLILTPLISVSKVLPMKGCQDPACDQAAYKKMMISVEYALYRSYNYKYNDSIALRLSVSPEKLNLEEGYAWVNDDALQYYFQTIEKNLDLNRITETEEYFIYWIQKPNILKAIYKPIQKITTLPKPLNTPGFNKNALRACYLYYYDAFLDLRLSQENFHDEIAMDLYFENGTLTTIEYSIAPQKQKEAQNFALFIKLIEDELITKETGEVQTGNYVIHYNYNTAVNSKFYDNYLAKRSKQQSEKGTNLEDSLVIKEEDQAAVGFSAVETPPIFKNSCLDAETNIEKKACLKNGVLKHIQQNFVYDRAIRDSKTAGVVFILFFVEKDGSIKDITVLKPVHPAIDIEAIRVISTLPELSPASQKGKPVRMSFTMPIKIDVQ